MVTYIFNEMSSMNKLLLFSVWFLWGSSMASATIRQPAVAGSFYPADRPSLQQMVSSHLKTAARQSRIDGQIIALIVPHAGLIYSGPVAAYSYDLLQNSHINKVILCGPSHWYGFEGISVYGPGVEWQTPLGTVLCNDSLCRYLLKFRGIDVIPEAQLMEHSLEVQLPYLQTVLKTFTIVPITMGRQDNQNVNRLAEALIAMPFDDSTVMISATDWQHYRSAAEGHILDSVGIECINALDADRLQRYLAEGKTEACGGGPTAAVIRAAVAKGANRVKILKYGDSGDITLKKDSVVGYVAAVLYRSSDRKKNITGEKAALSDADKKKLLQIARQAIEAYLKHGAVPKLSVNSEFLNKPGAAFVTLTKQGQLRGCIGYTVAIEPLFQTVADCAVQAATADPRFPPVTADEMPDIHIEISVLTPLQKVQSLNEIQVGRDGLMIFKGSYRGLLLPQVATEYGWDREQFLQQTCHKAGLPADAYKSADAELYRFQAIIFGE